MPYERMFLLVKGITALALTTMMNCLPSFEKDPLKKGSAG